MAAQLSTQKLFQIAARYEVWGSVTQVHRWFKSSFGKHETLGPNTIKRCHDKLSESGSVSNKKLAKDLPKKRTEEKIAAVSRLFTDDPGRSITNASLVSGLSYTLVRDILQVLTSSRESPSLSRSCSRRIWTVLWSSCWSWLRGGLICFRN